MALYPSVVATVVGEHCLTSTHVGHLTSYCVEMGMCVCGDGRKVGVYGVCVVMGGR